MKFNMRTITREQLKIFRAVVLLVFNRTKRIINAFVMDNFNWRKMSSKNFLYNKMRAPNVPICKSARMLWHKDKNITKSCKFTAFPMAAIYTSTVFAHCSFSLLRKRLAFVSNTHFPSCFFGSLVAFQGFRYFPFGFVGNKMAFSRWHNKLQSKEAVFSELMRTQLSVQRLLTAFNLLGITAFPLAIYDYSYCGGNSKEKIKLFFK